MSKQGLGSRLGTRVSVKPWTNHRNYKYRASWVEGGERHSKGFKAKTRAVEFAEDKQDELVSFGVDLAVSHAEKTVINEYRQRLADAGLSLRQALGNALNEHNTAVSSVTVAKAVEEFTTLKESMRLSDKAISDTKSRLGRFAGDFGHRIIATITVKELDGWLLSLKSARTGEPIAPKTWRNYRTQLVMLFKQCIAWGYCESNPATLTQSPQKADTAITVLSPNEAAALIANASDAIRPAIAIGLFAGCRVSEIQRLDWAEVNLETDLIELQSAVTKKKFRRIISIRPNLKAWLLPHAQTSGELSPRGGKWRKEFDKAKASAGFAVGATGKGKPWGQNAMRHSFASYGLQAEQNSGRIALEMGHRGSPQVLFDHYVTTRSPKQADAYWSIMPEQAGNVVAMG